MKGFRRRFANIVPLDPSGLQPRIFPSKYNDNGDTLKMPSTDEMKGSARWLRRLWVFQERLRQPDMKYAIKAGLGSVILASPAFFGPTRPIFLEYRGEWAMIAYFSSLSVSIGATNLLTLYRIIGTIVGAAIAVFAYRLFPDNAYVLPVFGWAFSLPCFFVSPESSRD